MYEGGTYAAARGAAPTADRAAARLAERDRMRSSHSIPPGARVLEIGAGDGKLVAADARRGLDAHGIDPSPAARDAAPRSGSRCERRRSTRPSSAAASEDAVVALARARALRRPGRARSGGSALGARRRHAGRRGPEPRRRAGADRRRPLVSPGRAPPPHPLHPRRRRALLARTGFEPERSAICWSSRIRSVCGRRCSTDSPASATSPSGLLKRDLEPRARRPAARPGGHRDRRGAAGAARRPAELAAGLARPRRLDRRRGARER